MWAFVCNKIWITQPGYMARHCLVPLIILKHTYKDVLSGFLMICTIFTWWSMQDGKSIAKNRPWLEVSKQPQSKTDCFVRISQSGPAMIKVLFLAATKQLYKWYFPSVCPSVRLSVCLSHLFDYVPIIVSSWNFQELLPMTKVRSVQKVKVRGQRSRSQRS